MHTMAHVEGMAVTIEARRLALGLTVQDLIEQTGLTRPGLTPLLRGERRKYQERLTLPICRVLKWTPDSIERLLAGDEPIELDPVTPPGELSALRDQVGELTALVADLAATVASLGDEVAQLRGRPHRPALGTP
jgi:hypothetical protein